MTLALRRLSWEKPSIGNEVNAKTNIIIKQPKAFIYQGRAILASLDLKGWGGATVARLAPMNRTNEGGDKIPRLREARTTLKVKHQPLPATSEKGNKDTKLI